MHRIRDVVTFSAVISLLACAGGEEKQILRRFFSACGSGDNGTVASVSLVGFPTKCESWEVVRVGEEATEPFRMPDLRRKLAEAKQQRDIQYEKGKYFLEDNYEDIDKIQIQLDKNPDYEFNGKLAEIRAEWDRVVEKRKELERTVQEINRELGKELKVAQMSLMRDVNVQKLDGQVLAKDVLVNIASESDENSYTFTLQKYDLTDSGSDRSIPSRWIIVAIREVVV